MASWRVTLAKAKAIASMRAGCVRAWALRRQALILGFFAYPRKKV
jgi:hypothetical protein